MDEDRLDEKARQAFHLAGPPVDADSFCQSVLAQETDNAGTPSSRLCAKSRKRKVYWRIALAFAAIVVVAAGTVAAIPSARAAAAAFFGFDSRSVDTQLGYLPDQSHWSKTYYILIPPQSSLKGGNECLGQSLYQNGAQFVHYKLTTDTGKPLPSGTTVDVRNHGNAVFQTGLSGALLTTSDDVANESFGDRPYTVTTWPKSGGYGSATANGAANIVWTCDTQTATKKSGTWTYSRIPVTHNADGSSSSDGSHAVRVSSGTWSYDITTGKYEYGLTTGKVDPFATGLATPLDKNPMFTQFIPPKTISYHDASSLTWVSNGIRVEILSNLSKKELIKVAEGFSIGREFPSLNVNTSTSTTTTSLDPASSAKAEAVAKRVSASLVTVKASEGKSGSQPPQLGLVYSADGLILTQNTGNCTSLKVTLSDGETVTAKLVGVDVSIGVELLRVNKSGLSPVKLASGKPKVGEWIALVTNMGSSLTSTPASVVASPSDPVSTPRSVFSGLINVKPAKWSDAQVEAFDKQGDCVGLVTAAIGDGSDGRFKFLGLCAADELTAAAARLLAGS
jgi:hypothetical protein